MIRICRIGALLALLMIAVSAWGQQSTLPEAPVARPETKSPFGKAAAKTDATSAAKSADAAAAADDKEPPIAHEQPKPDADNAFPEDVSRQAAAQAGEVAPSGSLPEDEAGSKRDQLPSFRVRTSFVLTPVSVKLDGRMVAGLTKDNFNIYEGRGDNWVKQRINFFTSDPFPLSAALLIDVGMADVALQKVAATFPSLVGSLSAFDEAAVYSYGSTVKQLQDFSGAQGDKVTAALKRAAQMQGRGAGPVLHDGPMNSGPTINGMPVDPSEKPIRMRYSREDEPARALNDAMLRAAVDLSRRPRDRRRVIIIISDGREQGSSASYRDVLKVLLTNDVSVYTVAVDAAAIPGYARLSRIRLPRQGYGNILPKYASATGGASYSFFTEGAIEQVYAQATDQARNQYTIGYNAPQTVDNSYREIKVTVSRPGLKVIARDGYYPAPPRMTPPAKSAEGKTPAGDGK